MGIDIGKNLFHVVVWISGAIVLRQKWSRGHVEWPGLTCSSAASLLEQRRRDFPLPSARHNLPEASDR